VSWLTGGVASMDDFLQNFFPAVYKHKLRAHENNYCKYNNQGISAFTSTLYISGFIASIVAAPITRRYGRRTSIIIGGVNFLVGSALNAAAIDLEMLIIGRVLQGVGIGFGNQVVAFSYINLLSIPNQMQDIFYIKHWFIYIRRTIEKPYQYHVQNQSLSQDNHSI
jgi:MFS family permease